MKFKHHSRVYFDQADPAGVIYFAQALHLAHQTVEEFVEHVGIGWSTWFTHTQWAAPIRHATADFKGPLLAGHKYDLELSVARLSESTVEFLIEFKSDLAVLVQVKTVHTFIDRATGNKDAIPSQIYETLKRYA